MGYFPLKWHLMEISFLGHSSFRIRGRDKVVVTDPYDKAMVGFAYPKTEAEIVIVSHEHRDHSAAEQVTGSPFLITGPGEYEVKDVMIFGIASFHDAAKGEERGKNTIYVLEVEGMRLCHLGDLGQEELTDEQLGQLEGVDILFVPTGGGPTLGPKEAAGVVAQVEPKIVIPMHYQEPGLNPAIFAHLLPVEDFLKAMGVEKQVLPKLIISREKLPEERQIIILERKG